ncbi:acetyl/propionyl/methylcrotonyl-CoA carboxylase subunit alpha [Brevibacterium luteolum]|uniref:biotin carboxylase n=1 Tax=Brevibacterium luteolum TaxID=199591 RepID=A0A849AS08_9MICO|nr:biotin carboxylase N-terminal domain-containing protein [Brevibacterium luteolum]MBM7529064.1 acetyl-CoA/propionyl-CoA carboxylase biotin carboxyl carrier protein [Brevibacterium luteolum]MCT1658197.1 ATP-grasp domain-containing protein [Brevibacterium luteolum]MCT1830792.1 ATP-grasp domain-containing protein [Brevibacterium luteolum]NNG79978.1 ATP-grasp domain-containing protein [Brevibacterium luteolum]
MTEPMRQYSATVEHRPIERVFIANRGEIALRIIRACHDLGLEAVAVYTKPDANADFVRLADDAWALDGAGPAETYLSIEKMIDAAQRAGADAIHPGYGYLAESPDFAQAVLDAGLVWVGPPPQAIDRLGDKSGARAVAEAAGAPITKGSDGAVDDIDDALAIAEKIGYPIAVKAVYGGGGRGFRTAASAAELPDALAGASREALSAFGRGECLLEQQIVNPRHIETQCMVDGNGRVLVASTRDCTLQRRNQKIIEEAPAPFLTDEQIATVTQASKDILSEVGYVGAATCEFLLGEGGTLTFMEVNARIQVEHTVTEEVTGVDLLAWQLRIAAGESLPEEFPAPRGHSIQFRINAEDARLNFFPATGRIGRYIEPAGPGVRVDSGVHHGIEVGVDFDPMLAKLIVTGEDRAHALARARRALGEYTLDGVKTLLPLHRRLVNEPAFAEEFSVSTHWLQQTYMPTFDDPEDPMAQQTQDGSDVIDIVVEVEGHRLTVKVPAELARPAQAGARPRKGRLRRRGSSRTDNASALTAPMQGTIVSVDVEPGAVVETGDTLAVIEAMKMEQPLKASRPATVSKIAVEAGSAVKAGTVLIEFED